ncbi:FAD dependent oxidoreductase [Thermotomaculum hydrothermale]|uniref:FAD dependent oxidoreductase n=1 Tax=Thermotomaculum hydrothermale TaxID=981385 RepID=A0A7R6SYS3_9BACT|nr:hypothetical protein [Thermotomaculum hydrothermale]BBB32965.1 FAD dependent oxidoreductase [Thermotomaculum hydrothermale]
MKKIQISNFIANWGIKEETAVKQLAKKYGIDEKFVSIKKRALDVRGKKPKGVYTFHIEYNKETEKLLTNPNTKLIEYKSLEETVKEIKPKKIKPVIVGFGPAGLFAALTFVEAGIEPIIIERGKPVEERSKDVKNLWENSVLNTNSNTLFGEGGAGTFSDGKLTTRINHPYTDFIIEKFVQFGAKQRIKIDAKPHIGTDRLIKVCKNAREYLIKKGAKIHFNHTFIDFEQKKDKISVKTDKGEFEGDFLFLAIGHSARDTYKMLYQKGVELEPKPFAVGSRVEHPQNVIDEIMYGKNKRDDYGLPPASYQFAWNGKDGRGAYTFCMCPGGEVILTVNEENTLCVNGMSNSKRNSPFANAALVAKVPVKAYFKNSPLDGIDFQREIEEKAYSLGIPGYMAPAQHGIDFVNGKLSGKTISCSYRPKTYSYPLHELLPEFVVKDMRNGLIEFNKKARGFLSNVTNLIGVETRTSAPLRIKREKDFKSTSHKRIIPIGEGSGYAGGIMSSALDGIKSALTILQS